MTAVFFAGAFSYRVFYGLEKAKSYPINTDAKLLVLDGDNVVQEIDLRSKFVFLVYPDRFYYTDTTIREMWAGVPNNLNALGHSHKTTIRKALETWE